jgi:hypothetical protein
MASSCLQLITLIMQQVNTARRLPRIRLMLILLLQLLLQQARSPQQQQIP